MLSGAGGGGAVNSVDSDAGRPGRPGSWATPGELSALQAEQSRCAPPCGVAACSIEAARSTRRTAAHHGIQPARNIGRINNSSCHEPGILLYVQGVVKDSGLQRAGAIGTMYGVPDSGSRRIRVSVPYTCRMSAVVRTSAGRPSAASRPRSRSTRREP